jgi:hypothetical protein
MTTCSRRFRSLRSLHQLINQTRRSKRGSLAFSVSGLQYMRALGLLHHISTILAFCDLLSRDERQLLPAYTLLNV